jgi:hypothetical protein
VTSRLRAAVGQSLLYCELRSECALLPVSKPHIVKANITVCDKVSLVLKIRARSAVLKMWSADAEGFAGPGQGSAILFCIFAVLVM